MVLAALLATGLIGVIVVFQLALAAGAPWGVAAWGGRHPGVLPNRLRMASAIAGLGVYPALAVFILDTAGVLTLGLADHGTTLILVWVLVGLFSLGALANLASPSRVETIWAPVAFGIAICCAVIATRL